MGSKEWPPCTQNQRNKMTQERNPNKPTNETTTEPGQQPTKWSLPVTKINKDKSQVNQECQSFGENLQPDYHRPEYTGVIMCPVRYCTQPTKGSRDK